jgi:hypothetical protein
MIRRILMAGLIGAIAGAQGAAWAQTVSLHPRSLPRVGAVDERFQSYNVEMAEVIGGDFWKPYARPLADGSSPRPSGSPYEARPPIDLTNPRLRTLAAALGPAYVRVSGTWANSAYFSDTDAPPPKLAPPGFKGVLTRAEWASVIDYAKAVDARILTSFAISPGVRNAAGAWTPDQAAALLAYTRSLGGRIAAVEFFNEPTMAALGGAPKGYTAQTYAADAAASAALVRAQSPGTLIVGPSAAGQGLPSPPALMTLTAEDLLRAQPRQALDVFSYHFYGALSARCAVLGAQYGTSPDQALSASWLARTDQAFDFYKALQETYAPGKPIWLTETAEAACGGDRWASTFLDSFRYLDQMGRLAKRGVGVIFHNTLVSSDYGLIDPQTLEPRPDYWAALLWRRLMERVVLDAGPTTGDLHLYAQCMRGSPGGVVYLAINTSRTRPAALTLPTRAEVYGLSSPDLESTTVALNGVALHTLPNGDLPALQPLRTAPGRLSLAPATISFIALPDAKNANCGRE